MFLLALGRALFIECGNKDNQEINIEDSISKDTAVMLIPRPPMV